MQVGVKHFAGFGEPAAAISFDYLRHVTCKHDDMRSNSAWLDHRKISPLILVLGAGLLSAGCASTHQSSIALTMSQKPASLEKLEARNNAASMLYDLLGDEKNVSKILIIKRNGKELGRLIKTISQTAKAYQKQIEQLGASDPSLSLKANALPGGEKATRNAVAKTEEHKLLFTSGKTFEFNLLLTQSEALNYGWHLAKTAAENSASPNQIRQFSAMSQTMQNLRDQVIAQMRQNK